MRVCTAGVMLACCIGVAYAQTSVVDFDAPVPPGSSFDLLNGVFDGIDWGNSEWRWEGPFAPNATNHIFFDSGTGRSRTFRFVSTPRLLESVAVFSFDNGTLTLSDDLGQTVTESVTIGSLRTVATGWSQASSTVTVNFTAGWSLGVDDITHGPGGPRQFTLTTLLAGSGMGSVASTPPGIDCEADCSEAYDENSVVSLAATPGSGSFFSGWSGDPDCADGVVTLSSNLNCTATFELATPGTFALAISVAGSGMGTVTSSPPGIDCGADCTQSYDENTVVSLTATAGAGSVFSGWSGDIDCADAVVTMTSDLNCTADFSIQRFMLTITLAGTGTGTVTSSPSGIDCGVDCSELFDVDTLVALTPAPGIGDSFTGWNGDPDCDDGVVTMGSDLLCTASFDDSSAGYALRFFGNAAAASDRDRLKVLIDDYTTANDPSFPLDIGGEDFTLEFWISAEAFENTAPPVQCGPNDDWIFGNILIDRDRFGQNRDFGLSIAGGSLVFGVAGSGSGERTICGSTNVLDGVWHHVAIQRRRSDGQMWLFVDGALEAQFDGPNGDISYPDNGIPGNFCGGPCFDSDPYLVIGAEKHDAGGQFPSYSGLLDEMRVSNSLRHSGPFSRPSRIFVRDAETVALYHFDEGAGEVVRDDLSPVTGPADGVLRVGGSPVGPIWVPSTAPLALP